MQTTRGMYIVLIITGGSACWQLHDCYIQLIQFDKGALIALEDLETFCFSPNLQIFTYFRIAA